MPDASVTALRGTIVSFTGDPFLVDPDKAFVHEADGLIVCRNGTNRGCRPLRQRTGEPASERSHHRLFRLHSLGRLRRHPRALCADRDDRLLRASSCCDGSTTTPISPSKPLRTRRHARVDRARLLRRAHPQRHDHGVVYLRGPCRHRWTRCSRRRIERNLRLVAGKVHDGSRRARALTRHRAVWLRPVEGADREMAWHAEAALRHHAALRGRIEHAGAARELAGSLWREHPEVSRADPHRREPRRDRARARAVSGAAGLSRRLRSLRPRPDGAPCSAHGVQFGDSEFARVHESGTAMAHCPTSNTFLGSGLFAMREATRSAAADPCRPRHRHRRRHELLAAARPWARPTKSRSCAAGRSIAVEAFYLATLGGARALGARRPLGTLAPGREADIVVLDPQAQRRCWRSASTRARSIEETLAVLTTLATTARCARPMWQGRLPMRATRLTPDAPPLWSAHDSSHRSLRQARSLRWATYASAMPCRWR